MVHTQALDLVERDQNSSQEQLMFLFKGQSETINNATQDLQKLGNSVKSFRFINELEENVVD